MPKVSQHRLGGHQGTAADRGPGHSGAEATNRYDTWPPYTIYALQEHMMKPAMAFLDV